MHPCETFARDALKVMVAQLTSVTEAAVLMKLGLVVFIFMFIFMFIIMLCGFVVEEFFDLIIFRL